MSICLGILSWKRMDVLQRTLTSYKNSGLLDLCTEKIVFIQEINEDKTKLVEDFGFAHTGSVTNVGIGRAWRLLANIATSDIILFTEEDFACIEPKEVVTQQIALALYILKEYHADTVRLRHRAYPGDPCYTKAAYQHNMAAMLQTHLLDTLHWLPDEALPKQVTAQRFTSSSLDYDLPYYVTDAAHGNYTNNPTMYVRSWFLRNIAPWCSGPGVALEGAIKDWWEQQPFRISQTSGLFTHNDRREV